MWVVLTIGVVMLLCLTDEVAAYPGGQGVQVAVAGFTGRAGAGAVLGGGFYQITIK